MTKNLIVERDVETPMRDGVILRADVYRPQTDVALPVLLKRTPYMKGASELSFALSAAERGYAVVIQDTRGCGSSAGQAYPFIHEKADGYDSVQWAANQPWSNGRMGMFGGSYVGYTQYAAASMQPPALQTITPTISFTDPRATSFKGGAFELGISTSWSLTAWAFMEVMRMQGQPQQAALLDQLIQAIDGMSRRTTFETLPLRDMPVIGRDGIKPLLFDMLERAQQVDYWQQIACPWDKIKIPALHIGGWYDTFIGPTLGDFTGLLRAGSPSQKVVIGPWAHGYFENLVGEVDFGVQASVMLLQPEETLMRWFDYWLKDVQNGIMQEPPITIFVMGDNRWRTESEWPLNRAHNTNYYLHSSGTANTLRGSGRLAPEPPGGEPVDSFVYDPLNPVPTHGGGLCCWAASLPAGAYDQREIEARPDVLVYTSAPIERDLEVTGEVEVNLWAASSAPDTDYTAKLVDVGPDGFARNVCDGILRVGFARNQNTPLDRSASISPSQVGDANEYTIELGPTSNVFKAGHCLRLEISSSNFPRYDRNPNTGHEPEYDKDLLPAHQTILHNAAHPSHIILPVVPR
jgi:putative CocE/NonD family hydrolase